MENLAPTSKYDSLTDAELEASLVAWEQVFRETEQLAAPLLQRLRLANTQITRIKSAIAARKKPG